MSTPYVYLIGWSTHGRYYYGRRTGKGCDPSDLWVTYFTSSIHVANYRATHGEPDIIMIRRVFDSIGACRVWEDKVLRRMNAARNPKFLNKRNGDNSNLFNTNGTAHAKDGVTGARLGPISITDPRWHTGEIVGLAAGRKQSPEAKAKMSDARKGTAVGVIISTGKRKRISLDDPRWVTGEVVGSTTGYVGRKQSLDHINARVLSRLENGVRTSDETRSAMSTTRKGKKPAYDETGIFVGLVDITDCRWGVTIFPRNR